MKPDEPIPDSTGEDRLLHRRKACWRESTGQGEVREEERPRIQNPRACRLAGRGDVINSPSMIWATGPGWGSGPLSAVVCQKLIQPIRPGINELRLDVRSICRAK